MFEKIAIGTANFTQPYGVLSSNKKPLSQGVIQSIISATQKAGINTFDTAFGYGDFLSVVPKTFSLNNSKIITKFSVLDSYGDLLAKLKMIHDEYGLVYEGLLIHDPQNLSKIDAQFLYDFLKKVKKKGYVKKIGVSVYDFNEVAAFKNIIKPDLIQIPLNPLNQTFLTDDFTHYVQDNNIEVHARSLFLQGVLLSDNVPTVLEQLVPFLEKFNNISKQYESKLDTLLMWANAQTFVQKWVLGVASLDNLNNIIVPAKNVQLIKMQNIFDCFSGETHLLVDPRNWKQS